MVNPFPKDLNNATAEELSFWVNTSNQIYSRIASDELTRRGIKKLNETISNGIIEAKKSSEDAERFTAALFLLSLVQLLVAVFQLIFTFVYSDNTQAKILGIVMVAATAIILIYFSRIIFRRRHSDSIPRNI